MRGTATAKVKGSVTGTKMAMGRKMVMAVTRDHLRS
jgi:hypothetical protein